MRISAYLPVDSEMEEKRVRLEQSLWHLGQIQPLPEPKFKFIEDEDWMAAWKKNYQPIEVGKGLLILPAWIEQTDMTRTAIKIDPAMAFGTGTHPTTQLCLALMEGRVKSGRTGNRCGLRFGDPFHRGAQAGRFSCPGCGYRPAFHAGDAFERDPQRRGRWHGGGAGLGGGDPAGALFDPGCARWCWSTSWPR